MLSHKEDERLIQIGPGTPGVAHFRRLLRDQIEVVEQGGDPVGVIRDPALNQRIIIDMSPRQTGFRAKRLAACG